MYNRFNFNSKEELLNGALASGVNLPYCDNPKEIICKPIDIVGKKISNKLVSQPIEGFDSNADGSPSLRSIKRYCEIVNGGFRFIWLESISIDNQGRSNPYQLWITEDNVYEFKKMVDEIRKQTTDYVYIVAQLTHSGRNSNSNGIPNPICAFSNPCIPKDNEYIIKDDELEEIENDYVRASELASIAGFDAVDIRTCHGYLINEFLAAYNRKGKYGGSFENRSRFLFEIIEKIKKKTDITLAVRLNMYDGLPYPYGFGVDRNSKEDLSEPLKLISLLDQAGVSIFNITAGIGLYSPFVIRPYDSGGIMPNESQFKGIERMLDNAKKVKDLVKDKIVIASAFSWLREYGVNVASAGIEENKFDLAGFGRQVISYPNMVNDLINNGYLDRAKCCKTCCGCSNLIKKEGKMLRCIFRKEENV